MKVRISIPKPHPTFEQFVVGYTVDGTPIMGNRVTKAAELSFPVQVAGYEVVGHLGDQWFVDVRVDGIEAAKALAEQYEVIYPQAPQIVEVVAPQPKPKKPTGRKIAPPKKASKK